MAKAEKTNSKLFKQIAVACLLMFVLASWIAARQTISGVELDVFRTINNMSGSLRSVFIIATQFGGVWVLFGLILLLLIRRHEVLAIRIFVLGGSAYMISELLKRLIGRQRPDIILTNVNLRELPIGSYGFPSGHATLAVILSVLILAYFKPKYWQIIAVCWVLIVGFSRIYLGVHAPLDILGGICLGLVIVLLEKILRPSEKALKKYL